MYIFMYIYIYSCIFYDILWASLSKQPWKKHEEVVSSFAPPSVRELYYPSSGELLGASLCAKRLTSDRSRTSADYQQKRLPSARLRKTSFALLPLSLCKWQGRRVNFNVLISGHSLAAWQCQSGLAI